MEITKIRRKNRGENAMSAVLQEALSKKHLFNVTDYYRLGKAGVLPESLRTELINGEILEMPPIGATHADWVDCLTDFLGKHIPDNVRVRVQNPLRLNQFNQPQPDILLLKKRSYRAAHPGADDVLLLIEVSDTTLRYDRKIKVPLYAQSGIVETWILDIRGQQLEIYRDPQAGQYRQILKPQWQQTVSPLALSTLALDLGTLSP
jgi:Uma2 family endonuclease